MGADLYCNGFEQHRAACKPGFDRAVRARDAITDRTSAAYELAAAEVDLAYEVLFGPEWYFRDSYNDTSVFWQLGLSWWKDLEGLYLPEAQWTDHVNVGREGCLALCRMVEDRELPSYSDPDQGRYFREKRTRLIRFLRSCAEAGGMYASC